ncbi:MAG: hypothetical protein A2W03_14810 [Candidatus Aminicenantes bacterium RBG_16_63_16]|nr:MAG: hypothetical protein A2W03_14810 [Candidatus Aminicenantes bacterium RBG_16_63_16]
MRTTLAARPRSRFGDRLSHSADRLKLLIFGLRSGFAVESSAFHWTYRRSPWAANSPSAAGAQAVQDGSSVRGLAPNRTSTRAAVPIGLSMSAESFTPPSFTACLSALGPSTMSMTGDTYSPAFTKRSRLILTEYSPSTESSGPSFESLQVFPPSELFIDRLG